MKNLISKVRLAVLGMFGLLVLVSQKASAQSVPYFELPTDFSGNMLLTLTTAGAIILGLVAVYAGFKFIKKIMSSAVPK